MHMHGRGHRLVSIPFSHYNEKARWALERFGVPYLAERYMPMVHALGVLKLAPRHGLGRTDKVSTRFSTPVLVTDDGRCIRDSSAIVRYVSDRYSTPATSLYPEPEVEALESRFGVELGPHTRRFAYFHAFSDPEILRELADANVSPRQARWFRRASPLVQRFISKGLGVNEERAVRSLDKVRRVLAEVDARLADGRRYLVGDRFTAADLALACMAAPILLPTPAEGYGAVLPSIERAPRAFGEVARELRELPSGRFVMRLFAEDRRRP